MLSITATIVSCLAVDPIAALAGVELRHHRDLLLLPWLATALPVFAILVLTFCLKAKAVARGNEEKTIKGRPLA
jgi:hypothetical protein